LEATETVEEQTALLYRLADNCHSEDDAEMRSMYLMKIIDVCEPEEAMQVYRMISKSFTGQMSLSFLLKALAITESLPATFAQQKAETLIEIADILLTEEVQDPSGALEVLKQAK